MDMEINKGIGRNVEFKGLESQYLFIFCGGLLEMCIRDRADIPGGKGGDIQHGVRRKWQRKGEQPPVTEKEQQAGHAAKDDPAPRDFLFLHALCRCV